jgi:hypothetical protein
MDKPFFYEKWEVTNRSGKARQLKVDRLYRTQREKGALGEYFIEASTNELTARLASEW